MGPAEAVVMEKTRRNALAVESFQQLAQVQRRLTAVMARHRLRRTFQSFAQDSGDDQRARLRLNLKAVTDVKIVGPDERIISGFNKVCVQAGKLMHMKLANYLLNLLRLDVQPLAPDIDVRPAPLTLRRLVECANQRPPDGGLG